MLDATQYIASPLSNWNVINPKKIGIIHSIMRFWEDCLASVDGIVVIFCVSHVEAPTRTGIIGVGSGRARSNQRNELLKGMFWVTNGTHE